MKSSTLRQMFLEAATEEQFLLQNIDASVYEAVARKMDASYESKSSALRLKMFERRMFWAVVLGLVPVQDGDQFVVLYGPNLQEGIAGFGDTPEAAIHAFEEEMAKPCNRTTVHGVKDEIMGKRPEPHSQSTVR